MNEKIYKILEFERIKEMLAYYATSVPGKEKCFNLVAYTDLNKIEQLQTETSDALNRIKHETVCTFMNVTNLLNVFENIENGSILNCAELIRIQKLQETVVRSKEYGYREIPEEERDLLDPMFYKLMPFNKMSLEIKRCIKSENLIADDASARLQRIRLALKSISSSIQSKIRSLATGAYRKYLSDTFIIEKDGTYCLAVRKFSKGSIPGVAHGESSTGSTIYIEPQSIVTMMKEKKELIADEKIEESIILAELTDIVKSNLKLIQRNYHTLVNLDLIFAKAYLAQSLNAVKPILNKKGIIELIEARHPLIDKDKVVSSTIILGKDYDQLVITGPNTGGKTIILKTTGIIILMGQAGLHIPAEVGSQLAVFKEIYADIGDEQSISQSLSFFSAHMTNIIKILENANDESLILIDELGAGTDPLEGACLAIAILQKLHKEKIRTLATTHYSEIKTYAAVTTGVENACCEFDIETLSPTYKLIIGEIGKSNAFAISNRIGVENDIIIEARRLFYEYSNK